MSTFTVNNMYIFYDLLQSTVDPKTLLTMYYPTGIHIEEMSSHDKFTVMLGTPVCKYTPYTVYCVEVMPNIILLVLCEVGTVCIYSVYTQDILRSCPFWWFTFWEYLPKMSFSMATKYLVCMVTILEENIPLTF